MNSHQCFGAIYIQFTVASGVSGRVNRPVVGRVLSELANFDPDELLLLGVSAAGCGLGLFKWFARLGRISQLGAAPYYRAPLYLAFLAGYAVLALAVVRWSAKEVRENWSYTALMLLMGGAWLTGATSLFPWMGISLREDALARRNVAAVLALSGAIFGVMLTFTGANMGEGPSFWNNVFSGSLATGTLLLLWLIFALVTGAATSVSTERDLASGWRLGGLLSAAGAILGRAIAGDWHSMSGTVRDFLVDSWPAAVLLVLAIGVERTLRPTRDRPQPSWVACGLWPAVSYWALAILWLVRAGWWEGAGT